MLGLPITSLISLDHAHDRSEKFSFLLIMLLWRANTVIAAFALAANAKIVTEFIPGSGCGTVNTIRILNRDPTVQEVANGCVYVRKEVSAFKPKEGTDTAY